MSLAESLMIKFAENTGLNSDRPPKRYLWTDAFAVCNFIQLNKKTQNPLYKQLAIDLIRQVHETLGKHRDDDEREGWLSGKEHPTKKGLRIGKPLPERTIGEHLNQRLEWERDGQYFHYLTKWMIALIKTGRFVKEKKYMRWAIELLEASKAFIHDERMYWKMSIDLSRPLISSQGQHDPLNGYVTYKVINKYTEKDLTQHIEEIRKLMERVRLTTSDPLGMGELLVDAYRLYQMKEDSDLISKIINAVHSQLHLYRATTHTLAFRELGLAIGLEASKKMDVLHSYQKISQEITNYWTNHRNWKEHCEINMVMLATALEPDEFLSIQTLNEKA
ncbi:MAG: hypothetical protein BAJALOKI1v1_270021 [Promethearchaeota archaeon]|nr:MAG: hypothetical protein BAJALOKI1v1_270021 [Candidatus Lokiarchaeota archaeon]